MELIFPDSLAQDHYICSNCKSKVTQEEKIAAMPTGQWVHQNDSAIHGYQINQLYSPTITPQKFNEAANLSRTSAWEEQEFFNSKLGETHIVSEAKVDPGHIEACICDFKMSTMKGGVITMGIDVGGQLHVEVDQWNLYKSDSIDINDNFIPSVIFAGTVGNFEDIDNLLYLYKPRMAIIDDMPDTRQSLTLARRHPGRMKLCHYSTGQDLVQYEERITVNRTSWLDRSLGRIIHGLIKLPMDIPEDWKLHVQKLVRKPEKTKDGTLLNIYVKTGEDHYAHARNYAEIALACVDIGENQVMTKRML